MLCVQKLIIEKIDALKSFGTNFGMSYQLIDDAIDYSSSTKILGKNVGDDFKEGKGNTSYYSGISCVQMIMKKNFGKEQLNFWIKTENDFIKAIKIINKYNCIEDTIERAKHFANIAKDSLGTFDRFSDLKKF